MKNRLVLLALSLMMPLLGMAQGSSYQWRTDTHSFGDIPERDGDKTYRFVIRNTGKTVLHILSAQASCGCTSPDYSKAAINPNDTGYVDVTYHPAGRPGAFKKDVSITTDGEPMLTHLTISGSVVSRPLDDTDHYPDTLGHGLRTSSRYLNVGQVSPFEGKSTASFEVKNTGKEPVGIKLAGKSAFMKVGLEPSRLAPGQIGKLVVTYDGKARKDFGYVTDQVSLVTVGPKPEMVTTAYVTCLLQEYAPYITDEEAANREHLQPEQSMINFGSAVSGKVKTGTFILRNTGKAPLKVYAVKSSCTCLVTELVKSTLAPGESTQLYAHLDGSEYFGKTTKTHSVYTSDPRNPVTALTVEADWRPAPGKKAISVE